MRKGLSVAHPLCSRIAAADHCETRAIEQLNAASAVQQRWWIAYLEQGFRIPRMVPGDQRVAGRVGPFKGVRNALRNAFGI